MRVVILFKNSREKKKNVLTNLGGENIRFSTILQDLCRDFEIVLNNNKGIGIKGTTNS